MSRQETASSLECPFPGQVICREWTSRARTSGEYAISRKLQIAEASRKRCAPREVCGELSRLRDMGCFVAGVRIPAAGIHPR